MSKQVTHYEGEYRRMMWCGVVGECAWHTDSIEEVTCIKCLKVIRKRYLNRLHNSYNYWSNKVSKMTDRIAELRVERS